MLRRYLKVLEAMAPVKIIAAALCEQQGKNVTSTSGGCPLRGECRFVEGFFSHCELGGSCEARFSSEPGWGEI